MNTWPTEIEIPKTGVFPHLVREPGYDGDFHSLIEVKRVDYPERDLFYIINGSLDTRQGRHFSEARIKLSHSFARDDEGDPSYLIDLGITGVNFHRADSNWYTFSGFLTEARFYPPTEEHPQPHEGVVKKDATEDYAANYGYPYLPPKVTNMPKAIPVEINIYHIVDPEWLTQMIERMTNS